MDYYKKKYDEALERARKLKENPQSVFNEYSPKEGDTICDYIFPELCESEDEKIRKELIEHVKDQQSSFISAPDCRDKYEEEENNKYNSWIAWLEKQGEQKPKKTSIWKHWNNGIAGNGEGKPIYLIKYGHTYSLSSCLCFECDYIKLSELDKLMLEKQETSYTKKDVDDAYIKGMAFAKNELEKQGEQKPTLRERYKNIAESEWFKKTHDGMSISDDEKVDNVNKVEPKFKVGDWVVSPNGVYWHIDAIQNGRYEVTADTGQCGNWPLDTNIYRLWTIADAKDGDVIFYDDGWTCIFKHIYGIWYSSYCFITADGEFCTGYERHAVDAKINGNANPATAEQRDILFKGMEEAGYEWDSEKKELKKINNEEVNGEDYGIDGLWHAQRILEKTLGSVDGYQTDDGILSHKAAITAVKKLYKQKPDADFSDLRTWKYIVDAVWTEKEGIGQYLDSPFTEEVAKKLQKGFGNIGQKPQRIISAEAKEAMYDRLDWGKEDESYLNTTIAYLKDAKDFKKTAENCINWLKSLKQRIGG